MMNVPNPKTKFAIAVIILALIVSAATWWWKHTPSSPVGETVTVKEDARVDETPKEFIQPKKGVQVYVPAAKGTLKLPAAKQADPKKHVTSAVTILPDERPIGVIAILDEDTGATEVVSQRMEYPLIAAEQTGEIRLSYGFKNQGKKAGRIAGREDLVQVKGWHLGFGASLDTDSAYLVDIGIAWKW